MQAATRIVEQVPTRLWALATAGLATAIALVVYRIDTGNTPAVMAWVNAVPHGDKLCHFGLYGLLSLGLDRALGGRDVALGQGPLARLPVAPALVLLTATLEELSQLRVPHRTPDLVDWLVSALGVLLFTRLARGRSNAAPTR